jgi:hypothetical protein
MMCHFYINRHVNIIMIDALVCLANNDVDQTFPYLFLKIKFENKF